MYTSGSAANKTVSCTLNLMSSKCILDGLHLICEFHTEFLFPHFNFFQIGDDKVGGTPNFQARYITVRYFLMLEDLKNIKNNWETVDSFVEYVSTINDLNDTDKVIQKKKFTHFIRYVEESLKHHFKRWTGDLVFLSLFSNLSTASIIARILKGQGIGGMQGTIINEYNKKTINKQKFVAFVCKHVSTQTIREQRQLRPLQENPDSLTVVGNVGTNRLNELQHIYLHKYSALPSNTQLTGRGVNHVMYHLEEGTRPIVQFWLLRIVRL